MEKSDGVSVRAANAVAAGDDRDTRLIERGGRVRHGLVREPVSDANGRALHES